MALFYKSSNDTTKPQGTITLSDTDLDSLLTGLGFGASGGGGGLTIGQALVNRMKTDFTADERILYDWSEAADDEFLVMAGGIGAPDAITPATIFQFAGYMDLAIKAYAAAQKVTVTGVLPVEAGPVNALLAMYYAWSRAKTDKNFRVYNVDGAGRAVPSLTNLTFGYNQNLYPIAPLYLGGLDKKGKQVTERLDPTDAADAESQIRVPLSTNFNDAAGLCCWGQTGKQFKQSQYLVKNRFSTLLDLGAGVNANASSEAQLYQYLISRTDIDAVYLGSLLKDQTGHLPGYDYGTLTMQVDTPHQGGQLTIDYINENMLMQPVGTSPYQTKTAPNGIAMIFEVNGKFVPYNNGDAITASLVGHRMFTVIMRQDCQLYSDPMVESFKKVLTLNPPFNYNGPITPTKCTVSVDAGCACD